MIITLIGLALLIVGITLSIIYKKMYYKIYKGEDVIECCAFIGTVLGSILTICTTVLILVNIGNYDVKYQNALHQKEMLEYRIEHMEENITGNEMLYNDIVEFNNELRSTKKWANNPWTNWFNNQDIAAMDYVELED